MYCYHIDNYLPLSIAKSITIAGYIFVGRVSDDGRSQLEVVDAMCEQHQRSGQLQHIHASNVVTILDFLWGQNTLWKVLKSASFLGLTNIKSSTPLATPVPETTMDEMFMPFTVN